MASKIS